MSKNKANMPGLVTWILAFIPMLNWAALISLSVCGASGIHLLCGILYGVISFALPSVAPYLWILTMIQFIVGCQRLKKKQAAGSSTPRKPAKPMPAAAPQPKPNKTTPQPRQAVTPSPQPPVVPPSKTQKEKPIPQNTPPAVVPVSIPGAQEQKQPIPKPAVSVGRTVSPDLTGSKFFRDMKRFEDRGGGEAPYVPLIDRSPTYERMTQRQLLWYFHWRSEVRKGNAPDTDESYVLLHVYELLSGCGYGEPQEGLAQLNRLWLAYRQRMPQLDGRLTAWMFDFAWVHHLEYDFPQLPDLDLPEQPAIRDLLIDRHRDDKPLKLTFPTIDALCDYSLTGSKFYQDGHQALMQEAIPRVVALADAALLKKTGKGILSLYGPNRTRKQSFLVFLGAVCPAAGQKVEVSVRAYTESQKLRDYLNELVRYGENVLRGLYGSRGRLRSINLDQETAELVESFLQKEYTPGQTAEPQPQQKKLDLDFDSIEELRAQSDAVRDALEVPEEDTPQTGEQKNEPAAENNPPEPEEVSEPEETADLFDCARLPEALAGLLGELTSAQQRTLAAVVRQADVTSKLERIAEAELTLPEILIDEINDMAVQYLDDILIDGQGEEPRILDQYASMLQQALKEEKPNGSSN